MVRIYFLIFCLTAAGGLFAQDRCGIVQLNKNHLIGHPLKESDNQFENWIKKKQAARAIGRAAAEEYNIPVVVHVIHKGEAVGTGTNISDSQILSQIEVLNEDFNRTNPDVASTPDEFQSVAAGINIHFVLAKQDPNGLSSNGIVRVKGSKSSWTINDEFTLKSTSYWPAEDYLNIWVTNLSSSLLGYAQFPFSNLDGLEDAVNDRLTDGVVIDYAVFGSDRSNSFDLLADFNLGRTTTHEVGHFLGLRHIWGDDDGSCAGSGDYVADTPNQGDYTSGCPSSPQTSCGVHTMFQNYMDYSNDDCLNLFTQGQVDRFNIVLQNSPRRTTLMSSHGLSEPGPLANDLGLVSIKNPLSAECSSVVVPAVEFVNSGSNAIDNAQVELSVNGVVELVNIAFPSTLEPKQSITIDLNSIELSSGNNIVTVSIVNTNTVDDARTADNTLSVNSFLPHKAVVPYEQEFNAFPADWRTISEANKVSWIVKTSAAESIFNTAAYLNFFNSTTAQESSPLLSPVFDLRGMASPVLVFDVAYAKASASENDALSVYVSTDCYQDPSARARVFYKSGTTLATAALMSTSFTPTGEAEWRREAVLLNDFMQNSSVQFSFVGTNAGGNNIFIDNVQIIDYTPVDAELDSIMSPSPVMCAEAGDVVLRIANGATTNISSLKIKYTINNAHSKISSFEQLAILPDGTARVTIPGVPLTSGLNKLQFEIIKPNTLFDSDTTDDKIVAYSIVDNETETIPLRHNFDDQNSKWIMINPSGSDDFHSAVTNYGNTFFMDAAAGDSVAESWFVSPLLDLSQETSASVFFDIAFRRLSEGTGGDSDSPGSESFRMYVSTDCGISYKHLALDESFSSAALKSKSILFVPSSPENWLRKFVDLTSYAGKGQIRVAFVLNNRAACDIYLDNIEFFQSNNPELTTINEPYQVYGTAPDGDKNFFITFNLDERQTVQYSLVDFTGRVTYSDKLDHVLNQTFEISPEVSSGMYILRLAIGGKAYASRIFVDR
jgi:hypothetical protein